METVSDVGQAIVVTSAAILAGRALVMDVLKEVREIIALSKGKRWAWTLLLQ